jgi:C4-dicarboxylate transporter, DctQ subunit
MKTILYWLNRFEEITASVALSFMAIIIIVQVFQRYVLQHSLDWPEELARYLFIYSVYIGASYAALGRRHLEVTIVRTVFGRKIGNIFTIAAYVISSFFCALMFVWGIQMTIFVAETNQVAPALQFPMYIAYICIPLGFGLMCLRTLGVIWKLIRVEDLAA